MVLPTAKVRCNLLHRKAVQTEPNCALAVLAAYQPDKKSDAELYQAYLQQQRRLACPGCGEEPFLG